MMSILNGVTKEATDDSNSLLFYVVVTMQYMLYPQQNLQIPIVLAV